MKSVIFSTAISNRYPIEFLYGFEEIRLDPYYLSTNRIGKKVVYGRVNNSNEIKMFEYDKILNIKINECTRFSPLIPIMPMVN